MLTWLTGCYDNYLKRHLNQVNILTYNKTVKFVGSKNRHIEDYNEQEYGLGLKLKAKQ